MRELFCCITLAYGFDEKEVVNHESLTGLLEQPSPLQKSVRKPNGDVRPYIDVQK